MEWAIIYFKEEQHQPVKDYLEGLPPKTKAKILRNLLLLSEFGPNLGFPYVSNVGGNMWELRTLYQGNQYRALFSMLSQRTILILHVFQKKTNKLPKRELEIAIKRLKRYQQTQRKKGEI